MLKSAMAEYKILVLPGIRGGINIPIALQSTVCRYYLRDVYGKEAMPLCEVPFNKYLPRFRQIVENSRESLLIVVATKILLMSSSCEVLKWLYPLNKRKNLSIAFVMERDELTIGEFCHELHEVHSFSEVLNISHE